MMRAAVWICLAIMLVTSVVADDLPVLNPSRVTEHALANGLQLVIKEERQWPVVSLGVYIRAGSLYEGIDEIGAAHLLEHLIFETTAENGGKLAPEIEMMGGRIAATTMRDFVHLNVTVASRYVEQVLPLLVHTVFASELHESSLRREIEVIKREVTDREQRADLYLNDVVWSLAFRKHPYGRPIGGRHEDLDRLKLDTLKAFQSKYYVPNNVAFIVVGDIDGEWLTRRLTELTSVYPSRPIEWMALENETAPETPRVVTLDVSRDFSLLGFAWHAPGITNKRDVCTMDLIYTLLGGGATGWLHRVLVEEKQVALSIEAQFLTQKDPGLMVINALVTRGREDEAQILVLEQIAKLHNELVSDSVLNQVKRLLYSDYAFSNESYDDQVGSMGFYQSIDNYRFALDYITEVMRITPQDIQDAARRYLKATSYSLVILKANNGDEEANSEVKL